MTSLTISVRSAQGMNRGRNGPHVWLFPAADKCRRNAQRGQRLDAEFSRDNPDRRYWLRAGKSGELRGQLLENGAKVMPDGSKPSPFSIVACKFIPGSRTLVRRLVSVDFDMFKLTRDRDGTIAEGIAQALFEAHHPFYPDFGPSIEHCYSRPTALAWQQKSSRGPERGFWQ